MSAKKTILGTTILEWYSVEVTPRLHTEEDAGESWLQSHPLLLADAHGNMAVGYCQQSSTGKVKFDSLSSRKLGEACMWALLIHPLLGKPE